MKHFPSCVAAVVAALLLQAGLSQASETTYSRENAVTKVVKAAKPSIVAVRVPRPNGAKDMIGTGVIFDERGFIITNRHVVGTSSQVKVRLADGTELDADVIVAEASWDLAVVRVRAGRKLPVLSFGPTDLMEGEDVIAIGHPFGYSYTVTKGIISALGREITMPTGDILSGLIQTSASINPGNSGGPLLNINGEFIGVNVALREGAQNIAFAINTGTVKAFLKKHLNAIQVSGIQHGLECSEKVLAETGKDRQRVVVAGFHGEGNGALAKGDEIVKVGACQIVNSFDVERAFWGRKPGDKVQMKIVRQGQEMAITLTVAASDGAGQVTAQLPQAALNPPSGAVTAASGSASSQR